MILLKVKIKFPWWLYSFIQVKIMTEKGTKRSQISFILYSTLSLTPDVNSSML